MRRLRLLCVLCSILVAQASCSFLHCVSISPQSPAVELGTNLTAFCILNQTCLQEEFKSRIPSTVLFWKVGTTEIPESQYTLVNDSVSSVTFTPTLAMHSSLTCSFKAYGQTETTLHGIYFSLGYPPEKPENLTCICYNGKRLTCTWEPGRATIMPTTYTLKQYWVRPDLVSNTAMVQNLTYDYPQTQRPLVFRASEKLEKRKECVAKAGESSCTLYHPDFIMYIDTAFLVEAENELGKAVSHHVLFDIIDIVKPDFPNILSVSSVLQKALRIEWKNPMDNVDLKYNLRYKPIDGTEWSEVPSEDIQKTRSSFTLQGLQSYTVYVISVRCKPIKAGFWSDWSKEYTATTSESEPSRGPELWRKISQSDSDGKRVVQLMWKDLQSHANGIILGYNVTVKRGPEVVNSFTVEDRTCTITVSEDSYEVLLTAYNSQGSSQSKLIIPSGSDKKVVQPAGLNFKAFPKDGRLWVEWTPSGRVLGYVIEWCSNSESMDCDAEWQREPGDTTGTFLRGDIKPFVYYLIRLNALHGDGQEERSSTVGTYLQQGAPDQGPTVHAKSFGKTWVTLVWKPIPLHKQNGFITNYTIKYGDNYSPLKVITVNATVTEYTLKSLAAKTTYSVTVTAYTEQGPKAGLPLSVTTLPFDNGEVEAIVVSSCLGFLVFILVLCFLFCNKREQIKKHIWPNVPDPSKSNIAQWSPQTPSRHESKRPPFQDGPFTDVSVVKITEDKKESESDQDLTGGDLKKNTSEGLSSGIGGSSCLSSPQLSGSDSNSISCAQNTSSTVQYSTVIMGGYQGQTPMFSRSESTQPLLISEERPDEQQMPPEEETPTPSQYFKQNFTQEDGVRIQETANHILNLAGFSNGHDTVDFTDGHNANPDCPPQGDALSDEQKTYLPQSSRQGGYLPQ
ncbi:interleukin-6 receptor subunit beta isoform X1 [Bufo gargarizans]|uniref:interleukin-6 receptor subunit beta isoform X1 n=1 Tax=Bufo gargarizans TaxID=30331 RepID=UPI001CF11620|nr:interleukin-6 receptor subunit beta isoform X1 [Bufo gargarizans]